ncbi:hypothetical protein EMIHUDRAFT_120211 [Emiliania huxleyi CCMP1516]|uniref:Methyltransferase domain-containing protein n=2 Tax=Emiliania huxleyi TaxID=2903 RepID=A0A0D3IL66_EMIH1|nr:hypothetical protein EMIHUDRAFT_120211 [Emiliania huxleyi CCMP1516]EOD12001.1 hypothetical protein EMIHUDRAFT_120211 [Emiliania huxleyi CCMP1516]|eukprot:XP_005764430.1 hypothetical protein EMIHUDRAFT_120211 [Emiliania huxleyi CCMP1516]
MTQAPPKPGIAPVELAISCVFSVFFTTNALLDLSADLWALDAPRARLAFLRDWYVFRQWSPIVSPIFLALTLLLPFAVFTLCKGALESICGWRSASRLRHTVDILEAVILVGVILPIGIPAAVSAQEALIAACKGSVTGGVSGGGPLGFFSADTTATLRPGDMSACKASAAELPSPHLLMVALNLLMWACDVLRYSCGARAAASGSQGRIVSSLSPGRPRADVGLSAACSDLSAVSTTDQGYRTAILNNRACFEGKAVLDVGAGSGILAIWAAKAGARVVYAVEATSMAKHARRLAAANGVGDVVVVLEGYMEQVTLPEQVDVIVSEWMGYFLLRESMLDPWLKPGGALFPSSASIYLAPLCSSLYAPKLREFEREVSGWSHFKDFMGRENGVDISVLDAEWQQEQHPLLDTS